MAQHKLVTEKPLTEEDYINSPELYQQQLEKIQQVENKTRELIAVIKQGEST
jgi:hypothetical protein